MNEQQILISEIANNSDDLYTVVYANSNMVKFLLNEGVALEKIHPDALVAYYVDYYFSQVNSAGFSKFVHGSQWNSEMNDKIAYGLKAIKSFKHLEFFSQKEKEVNQMSSDSLERFLENSYDIDSELKKKLDEDKSFYWIDDDIVDLNGAWLKNHKDTKILPMDEIYIALEELLGKPIKR